ncbi:hypothetical protein [Pseudomonas gingeri]|uniref:hypothetical protein n=1 Tax=Pseudomonas gingeri TaxID=117681 RepID=UPI0017B6DB2E|nr:hypothetical protein [Pseudomonas gingeri]NWD08047.1 hypothetical protein [Pseudomonas gingeri]
MIVPALCEHFYCEESMPIPSQEVVHMPMTLFRWTGITPFRSAAWLDIASIAWRDITLEFWLNEEFFVRQEFSE